jgi:hypothetical protein
MLPSIKEKVCADGELDERFRFGMVESRWNKESQRGFCVDWVNWIAINK